MIIIRQNNFSTKLKKKEEDEEKKSRKENLKNIGLIAAGSVGTIGGIKGSKKLNNLAATKHYKAALEELDRMDSHFEEHYRVNDKLMKKASKMGIKFKKGNFPQYHEETDTIDIEFPYSSTIAHEMGHAAMSKKGRSKDIIGRLSHSKIGDACSLYFNDATNLNANNKEDKIFKYGARGLFLGDGIRRGIKSSKQEESGNTKEAKRTRRNAILVSGISAAPTLIQELSASRKGIKYLKESGASKDMLKVARKKLGHAFGTYASLTGIPLALEAGGTAIGYGAHKLISKSKRKKKEKQHNNNTTK